MKLIFDQYRPRTLDEIRYHKTISNILKNINPQNIPHMLIYGPPGSGKKSILYSFLGYGKKLKISKKIKTSSKEIPFTMYWNDTYVEFDIKEMGMYGKFIIRDIIQQFAETRQLIDNKKHKIVVLHHIEMLTVESQYILNKIVETNMVNCKFILISNTLGNIINPLRSCCLPLRINALSNEQITEYISELNKKSKINLSDDQITKIVNTCDRNCKQAVLNLETYSLIKSHKATLNQTKIDNIVKLILKKRITLNVISKITTYLYEFIMDNNISSNYILLEIYDRILKTIDNDDLNKKKLLTEIASKYDYRLIKGSKDIMHVQAFIFDIMSILQEKK